MPWESGITDSGFCFFANTAHTWADQERGTRDESVELRMFRALMVASLIGESVDVTISSRIAEVPWRVPTIRTEHWTISLLPSRSTSMRRLRQIEQPLD